VNALLVLLNLIPAQLSAADAIDSGIAHRLGGRTRTHYGDVTSVDYSIDGRFALSTGSEGEIRVWNTPDGGEVTTISGHDRSVTFAFFMAPNSDINAPTTLGGNGRGLLDPRFGNLPPIVSASDDHTLRIWNTNDGTEQTRLLDANLTLSVGAISPDGKLLAAGQRLGDRIFLFDLEQGVLLHELPDAEGMLFDLEFSPDGQRLASGYGFDSEILVHAVATGELLLSKSYLNRILGLTWAPDGMSLALNMFDKAVVVNASDGELLDQVDVRIGSCKNLAFAPDGKTIYFTIPTRLGLQKWKLGSGPYQTSMSFPTNIQFFDLSPDGLQMICSCRDRDIRFQNVNSGKEIFAGPGHHAKVSALAFSGDSKRLISGSADRTVNFWNVRSGKLIQAEGGPFFDVSGVGYPGARGSAVAAFSDRLLVWSPSGKVVWSTALEDYSKLFTFAVARNGKKAWSGHQNGELLEWDLSGKPKFKLIAKLPTLVMDLGLSADDRRLAAVTLKGSLRVYSTANATLVWSRKIAEAPPVPEASSPEFMADAATNLNKVEFLGTDRVVTTSKYGQLQCRNSLTGKLIWEQLLENTGSILAMVITPKEDFVVTATAKGINFWAAADGRKKIELPLPDQNPTSLAFSPDGKWMASGMRDSSILIWQTQLLEAGPF
jgi:WD40 repeat protein